MKTYVYSHHGNMVAANSMFVGQHRKMCLCFFCANLHMDDPEKKCPIANELYELCKKNGLVTPVIECPKYQPHPFVDHTVEPELPLPQWFKDKYPHTFHLINRGEYYVVVGEKEPYFPDVYALIRENEIKQNDWSEDDEERYCLKLTEWKEAQE